MATSAGNTTAATGVSRTQKKSETMNEEMSVQLPDLQYSNSEMKDESGQSPELQGSLNK